MKILKEEFDEKSLKKAEQILLKENEKALIDEVEMRKKEAKKEEDDKRLELYHQQLEENDRKIELYNEVKEFERKMKFQGKVNKYLRLFEKATESCVLDVSIIKCFVYTSKINFEG